MPVPRLELTTPTMDLRTWWVLCIVHRVTNWAITAYEKLINLACPSAEAERSSMTRSTENTANQSRFPAQDRQVWIINRVIGVVQVSLKQRAIRLQKWSCRSMVKAGKNHQDRVPSHIKLSLLCITWLPKPIPSKKYKSLCSKGYTF